MGAKWLRHPELSRLENVYVLYQCTFEIEEAAWCDLRMFAGGFYRCYLDGEEIGEGPARYVQNSPEYDRYDRLLPAGRHVIAVVVHHYGTDNRMVPTSTSPDLYCEIRIGDRQFEAYWKSRELHAYRHLRRRVNAQLGWAEYVDTAIMPDLAQVSDGSEWSRPFEIPSPFGDITLKPKTIRACARLPVVGLIIAEGAFANRFGYEDDDPPVRFLSRDLAPRVPAEGIWQRFDLGTIGLYRPRIVIDAPAGAIIEAGYAESLTDGRVYPVIPLSLSTSCHVDRWIVQEGEHTLQTFSPRGFRYLEVHVSHPQTERIRIIEAGATQRTMFDRTIGDFHCSDPLLNQVWALGRDTLRACSEDALVDTPTRERGQWTGDAAVVGLEATSVVYGDLSLIRRSLRQAAACRRADGPIAGMCPGQDVYVTSYALYWIQACVREARLTGDVTLLHELMETAEGVVDYFWSYMTNKGVADVSIWNFIDWGHLVPETDIDVSLNLILLGGLRGLAEWERLQGHDARAEERDKQSAQLQHIIAQSYVTSDGLLMNAVSREDDVKAATDTSTLAQSAPVSAGQAGYHATVLGLLNGQCPQPEAAVAFIKQHMLACFPNRSNAPRLSHPSANNSQLITPYFAHFALQALWEAGEAEFVLEQYRICWGWMIEEGLTTLAEVFDLRWSHCHAWSAAPTWQLSRYALGLIPDPERGTGCYRLLFQPASLQHASGTVPLLFAEGLLQIHWQRQSSGSYIYEITADQPISIRLQPLSGQKFQRLIPEPSQLSEADELIINGTVTLIISA